LGGSDLAETAEQVEERPRRDRTWWLLVLLLLLLLLGCVLMQLLFAGRRGPIVAPPHTGLENAFGIYGLNEPRGVSAGPDGDITVSDTGAQRAYLYDRNGVLQTRLGGDLPADRVFSVAGSWTDEDVVYVCDWGLGRVWVFSHDGSVIGFFPEDPTPAVYGAGGFYPYDVAPFEDDLLVSTRTGIFRFDGSTLELEGRFDETPVGGRPLDHVTGIAVDPEGEYVWAVDSFNRRLIAYDTNGAPVWSLGRPDEDGEIVSFFALPRDVVYIDRGVLVSDAFRHELYLFDREGGFLGIYGERGVADAQFNFPEGMAVAPDGLLHVADRANDRVQVLIVGDPVEPRGEMAKKWEEDHVRYD